MNIEKGSPVHNPTIPFNSLFTTASASSPTRGGAEAPVRGPSRPRGTPPFSARTINPVGGLLRPTVGSPGSVPSRSSQWDLLNRNPLRAPFGIPCRAWGDTRAPRGASPVPTVWLPQRLPPGPPLPEPPAAPKALSTRSTGPSPHASSSLGWGASPEWHPGQTRSRTQTQMTPPPGHARPPNTHTRCFR